MDDLRRILIIAPCANGDDVGEAWSSFQWAKGLSSRVEATVLTYNKRGFRPLSEQLPGVRVIEWSDLPMPTRCERFVSMLKPGYVPFYFKARRWIQAAIQSGERFDLVHQVAPLALRYPSPAANCGLPFLVGPLAGSLPDLPAFRGANRVGPGYTQLRRLDGWRLRADRTLRSTYSGAAAVLGVAPYVRELLGDVPLRHFEVEAETGLLALPRLELRPVDRTLRLLSVGRLVRRKGLFYALRALAGLSRSVDWQLDILGDGEDRAACERVVQESGIADRVRFHGRVGREQVDRFYRSSDVMLFPSLAEPSGNVVFEAMAHALPVIACDRGGPGHVIKEGTGLLLGVTTPGELEQRIAAAVTTCANDPLAVRRMGEAARRMVSDVALWDGKIDRMLERYARALRLGNPASARRAI